MTTSFEKVLIDVFEQEAEHRIADAAEERETIARAKAGDEAATIALIYAYAPALRNTTARYRNAGDVWDGWTLVSSQNVDEARSIAVGGLIEAIYAFDLDGPHERLAATVWEYITAHFSENMAAIENGLSVPSRSLKRFYGIVNRAERDLVLAEQIAPKYAMSRETFRAIRDAVRAGRIEDEAVSDESTERLHASARPIWDDRDNFAAAEDRILVEAAFEAVDTLEEDVVRDAYGFSDYRPLSDGVIATRRGMTRPTVQRTRSRALGKMREALAVDVPEREPSPAKASSPAAKLDRDTRAVVQQVRQEAAEADREAGYWRYEERRDFLGLPTPIVGRQDVTP